MLYLVLNALVALPCLFAAIIRTYRVGNFIMMASHLGV